MAAELGSLRAELKLAGVFGFHERRTWIELSAMAAGVVACFVGIYLLGWVGLPLILPAGVLCTSIAMLGHEGSHRSFSASPARNALLTYFTFPMLSGLSSMYWHEKHDRLHHGHPNVEGLDPDIRPFPFASSKGDHERSGAKQRWFQRHLQRYVFWPMSTLMALGMRRSSLIYLWNYKNKSERKWKLDALCVATHYIGWMVIPSLIWGPLIAIGLYSLVWAVVGVCLALIFSPAHMGLPVVVEQNHDWIHQLETTRNLEMPKICSFFVIGLDHQVEHHLFPKIPHGHLPRAAAITAAWCKKNGIVYNSEPYFAALADAARFMREAWDHEAVPANSIRLAS
jgi:fatty acid desaturase